MREHEEATRRWEALEKTAKENRWFDEVEAEYEAAVDEISSAYDAAAATAAVTLEGLKCKARISLRDECDESRRPRLTSSPRRGADHAGLPRDLTAVALFIEGDIL
jgi:hypothetical protein